MRKILLKRILRKVHVTLLWCLFLQIGASATFASSTTKSNKPLARKLASNVFLDVTGVVRDAKGDPIPGVGIKVKGTQNGFVTDGNGKFTLKNVDQNAIIVFTSIGFKPQEVSLKGQTNLVITNPEPNK